MADQKDRPVSPHITLWRWGPHMVVSIIHRVTGAGLTIVGLAVLTWWLMALAYGPEPYADFTKFSGSWFGLVILIGLTWAFFQHLLSGVRHLVMDTGSGLEIGVNKRFAILTLVGAVLLTTALWVYLLEYKP
jgi:succinate dehydrogenase cytochrome b subunit